MDIAQLQQLCRKDPKGYKEDFLTQKRHFDSQLKIFLLKPSKNFDEFEKQIKFLSHVASYYKDDMREFPEQLAKLLEEKCELMEPALRRSLVSALILLRNRGLYQPLPLLSLFFKLFRVHDKGLRNLLYSHIVNDIKRVNVKHRDNKLNNTLQSFLFGVMTQTDSLHISAKKSLDIMIELYRKRIWNDAKTVNAISQGIFSKYGKIVATTLKFFLSGPDKAAEGSDEELSETEEDKNRERLSQIKDLKQKLKNGSKKSRGKKSKISKAIDKLRHQDVKSKNKPIYNFPAIDLLYDPQSYAEKVFGVLKKSTERFEVRLMMMNFVSRLIGHHKLLLDNFYPFFINYMHPKQEHVTYILAVLAQACHDLVESDVLEPILKALANNFVSDRCSPEVMAIGINTIREISSRCPLCMTPELLQDLAAYKNNRDKSVMMAARSLINFFRDTNPALLHKKDRGKEVDMTRRPLAYGETRPAENIDGIELLEEWEKEQAELGEQDDEDAWAGWEVASNSDEDDQEEDDEEGWVDVNSNNNSIEFEDSDDEENNEDNEENDEDNENDNEDGNDNDEEENNNEQEDNDETASQTTEEKKTRLDSMKVLTQEDFEKIQELKEQRLIEKMTGNKKRKNETIIRPEVSEIVDPTDIEGYRKKIRKTLEERMESVKAGREGRSYMAKKALKKREGKATTNEEKLKNKPFMLVRYSRDIQKKKNRSAREVQKAKRAHVLKQKNQKKYKH